MTEKRTPDTILISGDGVEMKGVYEYRPGHWKVYFRGEFFYHDEHGQPFRGEFYARAFREHLRALYHPDPARNRYDPSKFKDRTPYHFDPAFQLYLDRKTTDSGWQKAKKWTWHKYFMPYFANEDFRTIDQVRLEGLVKWLEKKQLKGKTIKNIMMTLHGFLSHFKSSINLFPTFPNVSYQRPRIHWFTEKQINEVFEFLSQEDLGYFLFLRYYGTRPEEASGLLRSALNWETREIIISTVYVDGKIKQRTKTNVERRLPIIPEMEEYLRGTGLANPCLVDIPDDMKRGLCQDSSPVMGDNARPTPQSLFVFSVQGRPYTRHMREGRWRRAMKQAVQKYSTTPMTLRGTFLGLSILREKIY